MYGTKEKPAAGKIRWTSRGNGEFTFSGLERDETDLIDGALLGANWISVVDGRLEVRDRIARLPDPIVEPFHGDSWQHSNACDGVQSHRETTEFFPPSAWASPSITARSLCGYYHTKENYRRAAKKMQAMGFECLRSRRNLDGRYHELWYLPYLEAAEGDLKEFVQTLFQPKKPATADEWKITIEKLVRWLCGHCSFGCLDVSMQRAAMTAD